MTAASVVAGALITGALALALSVAWELLEWWGHTYIDETVHVGYRDTIGDLAAGGIGGMIAGALLWLAIPVALVIGSVGAVSVFKAVYVDKRELKCACVRGDSNVPLGFISLTENLMMVGMAIWMLVGSLG